MMFAKSVAVIGSTTIDHNIQNGKRLSKIGGVTAYSGITYRRHGVRTYIVSNIAAKDLCIVNSFLRENITIQAGNTEHTTHFENVVQGDMRHQKLPLKAAPIKDSQIAAILENVSCIHLGPLYPTDIESKGMQRIQASKLPVFLDLQGYTRKIRTTTIYTAVSQRLAPALMTATIVKANESELNAVLHFFDTNLADLTRNFKIREFVVTQGKKGGFVESCDGKRTQYRAHELSALEDQTGAGDVFFAAYVLARFLKAMNISYACTYAAKLAAQQISGKYITADRLRIWSNSRTG